MPYKTVQQAEKTQPGLSKYSDKAKRAWLSAFNSSMDKDGDELKSFAIAYSVANKIDGKQASDCSYGGCKVCGGRIIESCRCPSRFMPHSIEQLERGHGRLCENGHRFSGDNMIMDVEAVERMGQFEEDLEDFASRTVKASCGEEHGMEDNMDKDEDCGCGCNGAGACGIDQQAARYVDMDDVELANKVLAMAKRIARKEKRIDVLKRIVKEKSAEKMDGILMDIATAQMLITIHDALKLELQKKFDDIKLKRLVDFGWSMVR